MCSRSLVTKLELKGTKRHSVSRGSRGTLVAKLQLNVCEAFELYAIFVQFLWKECRKFYFFFGPSIRGHLCGHKMKGQECPHLIFM